MWHGGVTFRAMQYYSIEEGGVSGWSQILPTELPPSLGRLAIKSVSKYLLDIN